MVLAPSAQAREHLRVLLDREGAALQREAVEWVTREAVDLRGQRPREETEALVAESFAAWRRFLLEDDYGPLEQFLVRVTRFRGPQGFHISTPQRGLLAFKKVVRAHPGEAPLELQLELADWLDAAYERVLFDLSDAWQGELVRQHVHLTERAEAAREAQTAFLADIGHEVRTPLSSLMGFADLIEASQGAAPPEEIAAYLVNLKDSARALLGLVDDLVDLARLEAGAVRAHPEDLDLWRLVQDVHREVEPEASHLRAFSLSLPPHLPRYTRIDGGKLARCLRCVLLAALRLSPAHGEVDLRVTMPRGDRLTARVSERGGGSLAQRRAWFAGLQQASDRRGAGPGLAVALASRLAQHMGGDLEVEGGPGDFAWRIELPVAEVSDLTTTAPPSLPPAAPLREVLVVAAPDTSQDILQELFSDAGIECTFVAGTELAVTSRPDVVLADSSYGREELARLTAHPTLRDVPWVVATADAATERTALLEAGAYEVLDKPLDIDELMGALISAAMRPPVV